MQEDMLLRLHIDRQKLLESDRHPAEHKRKKLCKSLGLSLVHLFQEECNFSEFLRDQFCETT